MKKFLFFSTLVFLSLSLSGCGNLLYLSKLGWHQSSISFHSVPVEEVLENEGVDRQIKEKILLVQEVKRYGEERLGLTRTKNYSTYVEVGSPVLYVITASEKDSLQPCHWSFPIIGNVTYKGFFTKEGVLKEKRSLEMRGYDTFVQEAGTYSTLGWLKDPIFSSMLRWDEATLANVILHEMTHATIYFKGQTEFNEQMATFVGNQGAIDFLCKKYGKGSREVVDAIHCQDDDLLFSQWIDQSCQTLSRFYSKKISRDEKLKGREELFQRFKEEFREKMACFKTEGYRNFDKVDMNNAALLAYRRYFYQLEKFQVFYEQLGGDVGKVVEYFKTIQAKGDTVALSSFLQ